MKITTIKNYEISVTKKELRKVLFEKLKLTGAPIPDEAIFSLGREDSTDPDGFYNPEIPSKITWSEKSVEGE